MGYPLKNNYRCIWTSSYDRGLVQLLDIWPDVKKAVPKAELTVTYGWDMFDALYRDNPERVAWKQSVNEKMQQPGITHLGRIGQKEMVKELQRSSFWTYPTDFDEISCISAMKAQVYGSIPVTMNKAALKETVQHGVKIVGDINDPLVKKNYTDSLISLLKDTKLQQGIRDKMIPWAKENLSWEGVAEHFIKEFKS